MACPFFCACEGKESKREQNAGNIYFFMFKLWLYLIVYPVSFSNNI